MPMPLNGLRIPLDWKWCYRSASVAENRTRERKSGLQYRSSAETQRDSRSSLTLPLFRVRRHDRQVARPVSYGD